MEGRTVSDIGPRRQCSPAAPLPALAQGTTIVEIRAARRLFASPGPADGFTFSHPSWHTARLSYGHPVAESLWRPALRS